MTIRELRTWGGERLQNASRSPVPLKDAEWLLRHVLGRDKAWLMTHEEDGVEDDAAQRFAELIKRREKGEPMQYILGEVEFYGMPFRVTPDVLIPRPETEHLVEKVIEMAAEFYRPRLLDVGTGSGVIAIAIAKQLPHAQVTATDLSADALNVARENAARNGVRVRFLQGDLLEPVRRAQSDVAGKETRKATADPSTMFVAKHATNSAQDDKLNMNALSEEEKYEIIASNPPYVPSEEKALLAVEVRDHEPEMALYGGADGLGIYRRLIPAAWAQLVDGGWLVMEMGFGQAEKISALMDEAGFEEVSAIKDLQGIERILCGRKQERE